MSERVNNKVVIVTGGALGIGQAACNLLAAEGAKVAITDINALEGHEVKKNIERLGGMAEFWHLDISHEDQVAAIFADIQQTFGKIDVLVNNAGIAGTDKPTHELTEAQWDQVFNINVKGLFFCTKHVIPYLQANGGGSIINLSSIYGIISAPDLPPYHASKGAVRLMTKTDALLYAKDKIRVNSIHPGFIWTPLVASLANKQGFNEQAYREKLATLHPVGHMGEPIDIAYGIVYLASDESKFITGSELVIDGGYTAQ
jgi:NAD(P)-dependent dehydrogenase (short-subunit alcohol dehydrogenase family)